MSPSRIAQKLGQSSTSPPSKDNTTLGGSCACGRILYECISKPSACTACNCITCRKLSGGAYQAFFDVKGRDIVFYDDKTGAILQGLPTDSEDGIELLRLSSIGERFFCADCHTPLGMRYHHEPDYHSLTLGTVDEETIVDESVKEVLRPGSHIFASQRAWWCEGLGRDGLVTHERFRGNFEDNIPAWEDQRAKA